MKICWVCEEHANPFKGHTDYDPCSEYNSENFTTLAWFGTSNTDAVHIECWEREK